jgi:hypothetical protein
MYVNPPLANWMRIANDQAEFTEFTVKAVLIHMQIVCLKGRSHETLDISYFSSKLSPQPLIVAV